MDKVFIDTDIIYDLLSKREPFFEYSARLFTLADKRKIKIYVSSLSFANLNYMLSRLKSSSEARKILNRFKVLVTVLSVDDKIIELSLNSDFKDFEDAIQYYCAIENDLKLLLTRNIRDYKKSKIPVMTSEEYLKRKTG
jgi:predicted nucleic acid-binding protein